jgi:hypothetical protein
MRRAQNKLAVFRGAGALDDRVIPARVELVELLGGEALVHLINAGVELIARLSAPLPVAGDNLRLIVVQNRMHLFEGETKERMEL